MALCIGSHENNEKMNIFPGVFRNGSHTAAVAKQDLTYQMGALTKQPGVCSGYKIPYLVSWAYLLVIKIACLIGFDLSKIKIILSAWDQE